MYTSTWHRVSEYLNSHLLTSLNSISRGVSFGDSDPSNTLNHKHVKLGGDV